MLDPFWETGCNHWTWFTYFHYRVWMKYLIWCHHMETLSALPALCEGNPLVTGGFPSQRASSTGFVVFFDVSLNKLLSKQLHCWWFEMPWSSCVLTVMISLSWGAQTLSCFHIFLVLYFMLKYYFYLSFSGRMEELKHDLGKKSEECKTQKTKSDGLEVRLVRDSRIIYFWNHIAIWLPCFIFL